MHFMRGFRKKKLSGGEGRGGSIYFYLTGGFEAYYGYFNNGNMVSLNFPEAMRIPPPTPSLNQDPRMHLAQNGYRIFVVKRCVQILTSYD